MRVFLALGEIGCLTGAGVDLHWNVADESGVTISSLSTGDFKGNTVLETLYT
jgi:hypothetical protein